MDFSKIEKFLKDHWAAGLIVAIFCIPAVWSIATIFHSQKIVQYTQQIAQYTQQINFLNDRLRTLEAEVEDLQEYKVRAESLEKENNEKKIIGGLVGFSPESLEDSLYYPSKMK